MTKVFNMYKDWLLSIVVPDMRLRIKFSKILNLLYETAFFSDFGSDNNRVIDGIDLRYQFYNSVIDSKAPYDFVMGTVFGNMQCSMLEMMCALAIKMEVNIMSDPDYGDRTSTWFEVMLRSLNLLIDDYNYDINIDIIYNRINSFLNRNFSPNGAGSIFTITNPNVNMLELDLWYQMHSYIREIT